MFQKFALTTLKYAGWGLAGFFLILAVLNMADAQMNDGLVPEDEQDGIVFTTSRDIIDAASRMYMGVESYIGSGVEHDIGIDAAVISFGVGVAVGTMSGMTDNCLIIYERGIASKPWGDAVVGLAKAAITAGNGDMWFTAMMQDFAYDCNQSGDDKDFMRMLKGDPVI